MSEHSLISSIPGAALPRPPKTRGLPLVGSLPAFIRRPFSFLLKARARYGDLYTMDAGFTQLVALNHPRQIEHVLQDNSRNYVRRACSTTRCGRSLVMGWSPATGPSGCASVA